MPHNFRSLAACFDVPSKDAAVATTKLARDGGTDAARVYIPHPPFPPIPPIAGNLQGLGDVSPATALEQLQQRPWASFKRPQTSVPDFRAQGLVSKSVQNTEAGAGLQPWTRRVDPFTAASLAGLGEVQPSSAPSEALFALVKVDAAYALALATVGLDGQRAAQVIADLVGADGASSFLSGGQGEAWSNLKAMAPQLAKLHTTWLRWAMQGRRDDGSSYDFSRWADAAKTLYDSANYQAGVSADGSIFLNAVRALRQTGADLSTPGEWPMWLKVVAGLAAVGAAAALINQVGGAAVTVRKAAGLSGLGCGPGGCSCGGACKSGGLRGIYQADGLGGCGCNTFIIGAPKRKRARRSRR